MQGDILSDLQDAFQIYDPDQTGYISQGDFRVILQNFGFQRLLSKKEQEDELKKHDSDFMRRTAFDFEYLKYVVSYRWEKKKGKEQEAEEAFELFDLKKHNCITPSDLKAVLSDQLDFPITEQDIADIMIECDKNRSGAI